MKSTGKILIIDDDQSFLRLYDRKLGDEGYVVETATDPQAALLKLDQQGWDAVLLDQKLQGREGPDTGLDLLVEVARRAPGTKAILVTAFATTAAIERAFRDGAYDYLQKDELFDVLLRVQLRNAVEAMRAQRLVQLSSAETEAEIRDTWAAVEAERDAHRKGKLLEDLLVFILRTVQGFAQVSARRENDIEEIDVLVRNESTDPFWANEGANILVECKNWSKPVTVTEVRAFLWKLAHRFGRTRLGFFVAPGGFTAGFRETVRAESKGDLLVVPIGREDLREIVQSTDRGASLKRLHERAVVEMAAH